MHKSGGCCLTVSSASVKLEITVRSSNGRGNRDDPRDALSAHDRAAVGACVFGGAAAGCLYRRFPFRVGCRADDGHRRADDRGLCRDVLPVSGGRAGCGRRVPAAHVSHGLGGYRLLRRALLQYAAKVCLRHVPRRNGFSEPFASCARLRAVGLCRAGEHKASQRHPQVLPV